MKLTIWFLVLILDLIIALQELAEANAPLLRKKKQQCKGYEMSCTKGSECCSGQCELPHDSSEEQVLLCGCSLEDTPCLKKDDCCAIGAVCRDKQCRIEVSVCGKRCTKGIDCHGSCPLCKDGKCVASSADCGEPCPSGSSFECLRGGLCSNKICYCGSGCKESNVGCADKSECCKKACTSKGVFGGDKVCS